VVVLGQDFRQVAIPATPATTVAPKPASTAQKAAARVTTTTGPAANPGGVMPLAGC
jgi:hypothetical protein